MKTKRDKKASYRANKKSSVMILLIMFGIFVFCFIYTIYVRYEKYITAVDVNFGYSEVTKLNNVNILGEDTNREELLHKIENLLVDSGVAFQESNLEITLNTLNVNKKNTNTVFVTDSDGNLGYVEKERSMLLDESLFTPEEILIYYLRHGTFTDTEKLKSLYDKIQTKEIRDFKNHKLKNSLEVLIKAINNKDENEHLGDYDTYDDAANSFMNVFTENILMNCDEYRMFIGDNITNILSDDYNKIVSKNNGSSGHDLLDRIAESSINGSEGVDVSNIIINSDELVLYKAIMLQNEALKVKYSDEYKPNIYNKDCMMYSVFLINYDTKINPDHAKYVKRKLRIARGETADLPELSNLTISEDKIRNYITDPYVINFPDCVEVSSDIRYIRDPDTNKILVSKSDIESMYQKQINLEDMEYQYSYEETSKEYFIDLSDIYTLTKDVWFFDAESKKLFLQKTYNRIEFDSVEYKKFLESMRGVPLPAVLLYLEVDKNIPSLSEDISYNEKLIDDVIENSYAKGYEDLSYSIRDYIRYIKYPELYKESVYYDEYRLPEINYYVEMYKALNTKKCWNFLTTDVKNFLSTKDIEKDIVIIEKNEETIDKFVNNMIDEKYDEASHGIPDGYEHIYKSIKYLNLNSNTGNFPENAYPKIKDGIYSELSLFSFFSKYDEDSYFYKKWYNNK